MKMEELVKAVAELQAKVEALEAKLTESTTRDRGPKSAKEMSESDAFAVKFGVHKDTKHKAAAEALGLSYGQVFSCRGGYTFKQVNKDWKPKAEAPAAETPAAQQ